MTTIICGIFGGIISSLFWGLFVGIGGWSFCMFFAKLINPVYKAKLTHHIFCFVVAFISFVACLFISSTNATLRFIGNTTKEIKTELINNKITTQSIGVIGKQKLSDATVGKEQYSSVKFIHDMNLILKQKYPIISKVVDVDKFEKNKDFQTRIHALVKSAGINNSSKLIGLFVDQYVAMLRRALVITRIELIIFLCIIQIFQFSIIISKANKAKLSVFTDTSYNY